MEHIGIDLGGRQSAICVLSSNGDVVLEREIPTDELELFFVRRQPSVVAMESCAESRAVALIARQHGHEVRVVPTMFVRALGVGARRIKNDQRDARNLAEASFRLGDKLPTVHIRGNEVAAVQDLVRGRASLIYARTASINFVRGWLRKQLMERPRCEPEVFCRHIREIVKPEHDVHGVVAAQLAVIDVLNEQIGQLDARIKVVSKTDENATRLQAIPGVGPIVALAFLTAVDDPNRFASGSHLASYVGLSPGENTTGGKVRRTGVIAAGQKQLRALLVQAAHSKLNARRNIDPMTLWARELLEKGKPRKAVICALARRISIVMWAMLRDGSRYDPSRTRPRHPRPPRGDSSGSQPSSAQNSSLASATS